MSCMLEISFSRNTSSLYEASPVQSIRMTSSGLSVDSQSIEMRISPLRIPHFSAILSAIGEIKTPGKLRTTPADSACPTVSKIGIS